MAWLNYLIFFSMTALSHPYMGMTVSIPQGGCEDSMGICLWCLALSPGKSGFSQVFFYFHWPGGEVRTAVCKAGSRVWAQYWRSPVVCSEVWISSCLTSFLFKPATHHKLQNCTHLFSIQSKWILFPWGLPVIAKRVFGLWIK